MEILDGKKLSEEILNDLKKEIKNRRLKIKLAVVLVGDDFASKIYVKQKAKAAKKIGAGFHLFNFNKDIKLEFLEKEIRKISSDPSISGVIVQLPLPKQIETKKILDSVPVDKDADVLSEASFKKFSEGKSPIIPPTVGAVSWLLKTYKINLAKKKIIVVGAGKLVGKPLSVWLRKQKADFKVLDEKTKNKNFFIKKADILISGTGKPRLINGNMVKDGVVAIDFGGSKLHGKTVGDLDFNSVSKKASYITPVPGGVGPVTVACLLENLVKLNR
jgi:methylenetetrahydrofolate dehydrogenase (NADP+) / methenyltetrahydrofolate cyclohydrolase